MPELSFHDKLAHKLKAIRHELEMETAIISFINEDTYTIVMVDSEMEGVFEAGMAFPLEDTYCRDVYKFNQVLRYHHVGLMDNMLQHPVYLSVKLERYLAAPINNAEGKVIGTVNFTSLFSQTDNFADHQAKLVEELAKYIEQNIAQFNLLLPS